MNQELSIDDRISEFFKSEYHQLVKRVNFRVRNIDDAEDIVMDAFRKAVEYKASYSPNTQEFGAWFNTIMNNSVRTFQKEKFMKHIEVEEDADIPVDTTYEEVDLAEHILAEMDAYPLYVKEVLRLFLLMGHNYGEIEQITGTSIRNARYFVDEFKNKMREKYA